MFVIIVECRNTLKWRKLTQWWKSIWKYQKLNSKPGHSKEQVSQGQAGDANVGDGVQLLVKDGDSDHHNVHNDYHNQEDSLQNEVV